MEDNLIRCADCQFYVPCDFSEWVFCTKTLNDTWYGRDASNCEAFSVSSTASAVAVHSRYRKLVGKEKMQ
jgi:DnaJ-domain-containing protein 1